MAPMKTAGKKLPPGEPEPRVNEVAISLQARASTSAPKASLPAKAAFMVSMPVPSTRGAKSPTKPTSNPPSAGRLKRRGDARACPGAEQDRSLAPRQGEKPRERRGDRAAEVDHGALSSGAATRPDDQAGSERFPKGDPALDRGALLDRLDHLHHAVATALGAEADDQRGQQRAGGRTEQPGPSRGLQQHRVPPTRGLGKR